MIGRIAWIAALLVLALVTAFAQVDRSARFNPALAPLVPAPFRGFAQAQLAEQALLARDAPRAKELARDLVRVRPLPAENLTLMAQATLLSGELEPGLAALELAGQRGWREPFAQRALAQSALLTGNVDAASLRIAALLATGALAAEERDQLVAELAASPEGRQALAQRMADGGHWQRNFVPLAAGVLEPAVYVDLVRRAQALEAPLDCAALVRAKESLRQTGEVAAAEAIDATRCGPR